MRRGEKKSAVSKSAKRSCQSGPCIKAPALNSHFIDSLLINVLSFKRASAPVTIRINTGDVNPPSLPFDVWFCGQFEDVNITCSLLPLISPTETHG